MERGTPDAQPSPGERRWSRLSNRGAAALGAVTVGLVGLAGGYGFTHRVADAIIFGVVGAVAGAWKWMDFLREMTSR